MSPAVGSAPADRFDRLTAADLLYLRLETPEWPAHFGVLMVADAQPLLTARGDLDLPRIRAELGARLDRVPKLRRRILRPGVLGGRPVWVDDVSFDLARHVRAAPVPAPGGEPELLEAALRLQERRLDREHPLWELWFLHGTPDGRVGVLLKLHHSVADGQAALAVMGELFDAGVPPSPARAPGTAAPPSHWVPVPPPGRVALIGDNVAGRMRWLRSAAHVARARRSLDRDAASQPVAARPVAVGAAPRPDRSRAGSGAQRLSATGAPDRDPGAGRRRRDLREVIRGLVGGRAGAVRSLNPVVGRGRRLARLEVDLAALRGQAHSEGATINDLVLTLWAGGLRRLLLVRGESVADLEIVASIPVSLRAPGAPESVDNRTGTMLVDLPAWVDDPRQRLRLVARRTREARATQSPAAAMGVLAALMTTPLGHLLMTRQRVINVLATNVRGPEEEIRLLGAPVRTVIPILDLIGNVGLVLAAFSSAGRMALVVTADAGAFGDVARIAEGMAAEWEGLVATSPG